MCAKYRENRTNTVGGVAKFDGIHTDRQISIIYTMSSAGCKPASAGCKPAAELNKNLAIANRSRVRVSIGLNITP